MSRLCLLPILVLIAESILSPLSSAQAALPVVFYSDLVSGPSAGGEGNNGVILTITGKNFATKPGTVTIGGGAAATYKTWTDTKIQVAIGLAAATGQIVVKAGGKTSACANTDIDRCTFTVRPGNIFYVSPSGSDAATGAFSAPWQTLYHAIRSIVAGDTIYAENGLNISAPDGTGWHAALLINSDNGAASGTAGTPVAIVAYPGATVSIGSLTAVNNLGDTTIYGLRMINIKDYVISGLTLRGPNVAMSVVGGLRNRVINNDIAATDSGAAIQGALTVTEGSYSYVYGNSVHDVGTSNKEGHAVYFSTDNNHDWFGWNRLVKNLTCYSLQFHSSPTIPGSGNDLYDIHVHDNYFNGDRCAGLNLATVDPSKGVVEVYNNVFFHVGIGPPPAGGAYSFACILAAGILNKGPAPWGTVQIYNNTLFDCGSAAQGAYAALDIADEGGGKNIKYNFTNNIISLASGSKTPYFAFIGASPNLITCSNDLFFGNASAPGYCAARAVNADPKFVSTSVPDLHLQSGSPALGAGASSPVPVWDYDGNARSAPNAIGAYGGIGVGTLQPGIPTRLQGVVK